MANKVYCGQCKELLAESTGAFPRSACPFCGSMDRHYDAQAYEAVGIKEFVEVRHKNPAFPSKGKLRIHYKFGDELYRDRGIWIKKDWMANRDSDRYKEIITVPETGEIIHHCEEPLSQHINHGTAKKKG